MPRNGSGSYNLPAGQPVVTNTVISSSVQNTLTADLATALTASIAADGQTPVTANLPMTGFKHTNVANGVAATDYAALGQVQTAGQSQTYTAFTTAGTAPAYTITSLPLYGAYAANQRMRVKFHSAGTAGNNQLNRDGLGAKNIKQYDSSGAKIPAVITANLLADVEYDGTDMVILDPLPVLSSINSVINGSFVVNQQVVSGTVTLGAGIYGHDMWKAGAAGCTYTFSTTNGLTTLNISAGSLQQVIESVNVPSGVNTMVLSWTGSAQGKIAAGAYAASGVTASVTGGSDLTIEFNTGTLTKVKLELGAAATAFVARLLTDELILCQRYFELVSGTHTNSSMSFYHHEYKVTKRSTPTITLVSGSTGGADFDAGGAAFSLRCPVGTVGAGGTLDWTLAADARL